MTGMRRPALDGGGEAAADPDAVRPELVPKVIGFTAVPDMCSANGHRH
jgi:hypothetical protein